MDDVVPFGVVIAIISVAGLLAVLSNRVSERIRVPAPAIFLVAAAVASDLVPALGRVPILTVQRVVTVMLILLLFDGGMHIGWRRFRAAGGGVLWIGVVGTVVTAVGVAVLAHLVFGFDWRAGLLLGVAVAPTDPAVVFSVLGRREIAGRSGTLLEGESGVNDPVGIAAMAALLAAGTAGGWRCAGYHCPAGRCTRCGPCWVPGRSTGWPAWPTGRGFSPCSSPESSSGTCAPRTRPRSNGSTRHWPAWRKSSRSPCSA